MARLVVEVYGRGMSVFERVDTLPCRIGRAPSNDVILADSTVSAYHAEIIESESGGVAIVDLDSENGTFIENRRVKLVSQPISLPESLRLGHTRLQVMDAASEVEPTRVLGCQGWFSCLFESPYSCCVLVLLALCVAWVDVWFSVFSRQDIEAQLWFWLTPLFALFGSTVLLTTFQRMAVGRWGIGSSLTLAAVFMLAINLLDWLGPAANYVFTEFWPKYVLSVAILGVLFPILVWLVLVHVRHVPRGAVAFYIVIVTGLNLLNPAVEAYRLLSEPDASRRGIAVYPSELLTFDARLKPTITIEAFVSKARALEAGAGHDVKAESGTEFPSRRAMSAGAVEDERSSGVLVTPPRQIDSPNP